MDLEIARWFSDHRSALVTHMFRLMDDAGTNLPFFVVVAVLALCFVAALRLWGPLLRVLLAILFALVGAAMLVMARLRPPVRRDAAAPTA